MTCVSKRYDIQTFHQAAFSKQIPMTRKIKVAYIISLLARITIETTFIRIGMELYNLNVRRFFYITVDCFQKVFYVGKIFKTFMFNLDQVQ